MTASAGTWDARPRGTGLERAPRQTASAPAGARAAGGRDRPPVVVFETSFALEAEVVRAFLESCDIPAAIGREAVSQAYPLTVGELAAAQVLVPAALAERARELLAASRRDAGTDAA